ncbi:translation initiation factor IF-2 [Streptomyces sp. NPDC013161]|uniref:WXG100 family type VII secretion target n=1 Tax=Streptomyces sp. NPDC013161 TaxID=3364862 RepID=UPI0036AB4941
MSAAAPGTGSTSFEEMSHEQMLAWLDQANSGTVRLAADRLTAAAQEIRRIGEELKVRPQYVEWKGEGSDAFRTWAGDLANSTLRLGDFSDDAAKWLGQTSDAIAHVQASIPRDTKKSAQANPNAATRAHNAPDTTAVTPNSATELAAIAAAKEKVRHEAALQMLKLGQSYRLSATQLDGLERPVFPPPPKAVQPPDARGRGSQSGIARPSAGDSRTPGAPAGHLGVGEIREPKLTSHHGEVAASAHVPTAMTIDPSVRVGVDSVGTLPRMSSAGAGTSDGPSGMGQPHSTATTPPGGSSGNPVGSTAPGRVVSGSARSEGVLGRRTALARPTVTGRSPATPGQGAPVPNSGRVGGSSVGGVVGGRPTGTPTGRPAGAIPRGTVVGAENPTGRGPVGSTAGGGRAVSPNRGVVGGAPQQPGRVPSSRSGAGGTGGTGASGAAVRDGVSGRTPSAGRPGAIRGSATALASASAALIWSEHPTWTNNQVLRVLLNTIGAPTDGAKRNDSIGYGIVRPRIALQNPGDPGPASEYPLPDLAAAQTSPSPGSNASASSAADAPAKGDDLPAAVPSSGDTGGSALWTGLGVGAAVLAGGGAVAFLVRRRRHA